MYCVCTFAKVSGIRAKIKPKDTCPMFFHINDNKSSSWKNFRRNHFLLTFPPVGSIKSVSFYISQRNYRAKKVSKLDENFI